MNSETIEPWKCYQCKRVCSGYHLYCGKCGQSWETCADPNFVPPKRGQRAVQWNYNATPADQWDSGNNWIDDQMGPVPEKASISKAKIKKEGKRCAPDKGKRIWKTHRRTTKFWTTCLAITCLFEPPMDDLFRTAVADVTDLFGSLSCGIQGRQRARSSNAIPGDSVEKTQRRIAPGCSNGHERDQREDRSGRDQNSTRCCVTAWQGSKRARGSTGRQATVALLLEELPIQVSGTMEDLYNSIHGAGESCFRASCNSPRKPHDSQGAPRILQISCGSRFQEKKP